MPNRWDEPLAELFGAAFVQVVGAGAIVIGHDMRPSSPGLSAACARGAADHGADVTLIGRCSTDQLYYASEALDLPGQEVTTHQAYGRSRGARLR